MSIHISLKMSIHVSMCPFLYLVPLSNDNFEDKYTYKLIDKEFHTIIKIASFSLSVVCKVCYTEFFLNCAAIEKRIQNNGTCYSSISFHPWTLSIQRTVSQIVAQLFALKAALRVNFTNILWMAFAPLDSRRFYWFMAMCIKFGYWL